MSSAPWLRLLSLVSQKRVRKRLKKYFPKDFQDTTWTVAVQWNHAKYEVQTTKVRISQSVSQSTALTAHSPMKTVPLSPGLV